MISAVAEPSKAFIDEVKYHYFLNYEILKKMENLAKTDYLVFSLFVGNKHHYNLLKFLRIVCSFLYFSPKSLPKLFVPKVDSCIKVVALI